MVEVGVAEVSMAKISIVEECSAKECPTEISMAEIGPAEIGRVEKCFTEMSVTEVGMTEVNTGGEVMAKECFTKNSLAKVSTSEIGRTEVSFCLRMLFSPRIPNLHTLPDQFKLFLICHMLLSLQLLLFYIDVYVLEKSTRMHAVSSLFLIWLLVGIIWHSFLRCRRSSLPRGTGISVATSFRASNLLSSFAFARRLFQCVFSNQISDVSNGFFGYFDRIW